MVKLDIKDKIQNIKLDKITEYSNNPKAHPTGQIEKIKASIKEYGFTNPIIVDSDNTIIAGHGRVKAARKLSLEEIPVIKRDDLTKSQAKALRLADNRIAESDWEEDMLEIELESLEDQGFDLELTGFDQEEIDEYTRVQDANSVEQVKSKGDLPENIEDWKVLNLYAGIGGNRKFWGDAQVTAVEYNEEIAKAYQDHYPEDEVVVADAHEYLLENFQEFDFIWSSPPCPTHSRIRKNTAVESGHAEPVYPDMRLYKEILLLKGYFNGLWVVENVESWYDPLIEPQNIDRHYFWSNFKIQEEKIDKGENTHNNSPEKMEEFLGYDLSSYSFPEDYPKQKILNNCVHPRIGEIILKSAAKDRGKEE